jgi:hypothetical protein
MISFLLKHTQIEYILRSHTCLPAKKNVWSSFLQIVIFLGTSTENIDINKWLFHQVTSILHMIAKKIDASKVIQLDKVLTSYADEYFTGAKHSLKRTRLKKLPVISREHFQKTVI